MKGGFELYYCPSLICTGQRFRHEGKRADSTPLMRRKDMFLSYPGMLFNCIQLKDYWYKILAVITNWVSSAKWCFLSSPFYLFTSLTISSRTL